MPFYIPGFDSLMFSNNVHICCKVPVYLKVNADIEPVQVDEKKLLLTISFMGTVCLADVFYHVYCFISETQDMKGSSKSFPKHESRHVSEHKVGYMYYFFCIWS